MPGESPIDPVKQALAHLESLKAWGIDWLPRQQPGQPLPMPDPPWTPDSSAHFNSGEAAPGIDPQEPSNRRVELDQLSDTVSHCLRCKELASTRTQTVFGVGPIDPELCIIGEAPGADEDRLGEPFVGAAGQLLNRILAACGFQRDEVYICNIIKCRPPGNRTPRPDETGNCSEYLHQQLALVRPRFICCMGGTAAHNLLGTTESMGRLRQRFHEFQGIPVLCTYHPAYLLPHRNPDKKRDVWEDMQKMLKRMNRPIPPSSQRPAREE